MSMFTSLPGHISTLNGIVGAATITGTNITVTTLGQIISLTAPSSTPGGSDTQVQFNSSSTFAGDSNLTWDNTNKRFSVKGLTVTGMPVLTTTVSSQTGTNIVLTAPTTPVVRLTNAGLSVIGSVSATGAVDGTTFIIENNTGNSLILQDEFASATAANRIRTSLGGTGVNYQINDKGTAMLVYNTTLSRWIIQGVPFGLVTAGVQTFNGDKTLNGSWTATNFTSTANLIALGNIITSGTIQASSNIHSNVNVAAGADVTAINNVVAANGILGAVYAQAPLVNTNLLSSIALTSTTGIPSSFNASLTLATQLASPGAVATTAQPHLQRPPMFGGTQNNGGGGFVATGLGYEYIIYSYNPALDYCVAFTSTGTLVDDGSTSNFTWDLSWSDAQPSSADFIQGYLLGRNINGAGWAYEDVGNVLAFNDDNSALFAASPPGTPANDYLSNGTTRQYYAANKGTSPSGTLYYSPTTNYTYADGNNGDAYRVQHTFSGTLTASWRVLGDDSGTALNHIDTAIDFIEEPGTFSGSGATVTPDNYGINANGSNLNLDFELFGRAAPGSIVYSSSFASASVVDPNDGLDYYLTLSWSAGAGNTSYKILHSTDGGGTYPDAKVSTASPLYVDQFSTWPDNTTVTPTSSPLQAGKFTNTALSSLDAAQVEIISSGASYGRIQFIDSLGANVNAMESQAGGIRFIQTGLGFFGHAPSAQNVAGANTAGATYTSNEQTMLQVAYNCLRAYGLLG